MKEPGLADAANFMSCLFEILSRDAGDDFLFLVKRQSPEAKGHAVRAGQALQAGGQVDGSAGIVAIAKESGIVLVSIEQPLKP